MCELARGLGLLKKQSHNAERYPLLSKEAAASPCFATIPLSQNLASERKTALSLESTFEGCLISQSLFYFNTILRIAVGTVVALQLMVKVSELSVRAFAISRNTAALLTQD